MGCKHRTDYHGRVFPVILHCGKAELRPVTFLTAAPLCPLLQHMGCLGGHRRALPPRLQGVVEERITLQRLNLKAITSTN